MVAPVRKVANALAVLSLLLVCGELFARYYLGLGTPALIEKHPSIEYVSSPNQDVSRFGNRIFINEFGMRSDPLLETVADSHTRVMVFGDSVVYGGNQVDQSQLATSLLQTALRQQDQDAEVGNVSANSWGPGNWLAYAEKYGFFDANVIALVLSAHDERDNPTFAELNENSTPTHAPLSALIEAITRYSNHLIGTVSGDAPSSPPKRVGDRATSDRVQGRDQSNIETQQAMADLLAFLTSASESGAQVLVFYHLEKIELETKTLQPGYQTITDALQSVGLDIISLEPYYQKASKISDELYLDRIHPSVLGQAAIATALLDQLRGSIQQ